jgi:iron complex outermembrane receptor protein
MAILSRAGHNWSNIVMRRSFMGAIAALRGCCYRALILASALSFQPAAALAQSAEDEEYLALAYGDKTTISIATGSPQSLRRAPAVASVITAEDIAAMGATDLDEVLESVAGVHVSRASVRYAPMYIIRGIGGGGQTNPQVLLLQNGIPMTTMFNGDKGAAWVGVPLENIARIEIIRGPGSALYGADAYAGVINLITKTAADTPGTEFGARVGSFGSRKGWVQHGGKLGAVDAALYLRVGSTDGLKEIIGADAQTRNDRLFGTHASLAPGSVNTGYDAIDGGLNLSYDQWRLRAGYKQRDQLQTGAGINAALDPASQAKAETVNADLSWSDPQLTRNWSVGVTGSFLHYAITYPNNVMLLPPGTRLPSGTFPDGMIGGPNQWERQYRLSAHGTYSGFAGHHLRIGLGHDDLGLYDARTYKNYLFNAAGAPVPAGPVADYSAIQPHIRPQLRKIDYLYVQDEWSLARDWVLTAGVRHDNYSDFGGTTHPRLALVWDAAFDLTAKLLVGRAFRAPSFNEQYGINPVGSGNPNLRPESIKTVEAALSWKASQDSQVNLGLFHFDMQDIIRLVGTAYANTGAQRGNGMEVEAVWDVSRSLRFTGNYAYQKSLDRATGQDAGYAPHHHLYARGDWRFTGNWMASTQLNWVADRKRAVGDLRPAVPDYTTVDLTLRTMNSKNQWNFAASLRNLFNATVLEPSLAPGLALPNDLPMAPRSVSIQAIFRW